ncbi:hypothetical protein CCP1ISM_3650002 [Azospirillaceae bacterium]
MSGGLDSPLPSGAALVLLILGLALAVKLGLILLRRYGQQARQCAYRDYLRSEAWRKLRLKRWSVTDGVAGYVIPVMDFKFTIATILKAWEPKPLML